MDHTYAFLDTNAFLHFRLFDEIDWPKLLGCDAVTLVLAPVNLGELDKKKYEGPSKVRERAQLVARRLGTYVDQVMPACVRDGVSLVFLADEAALDFVSLGLGKTNQDDRLLASMIEFKGQRSAARVVVVTADNLLRVKARARDLDVVVLPGELRLPSEPDPLEKRNKELEREVLELKRLSPRLSLSFSNGTDRLPYKLTTPPILTRDELEFQKKRTRLMHKKIGEAPSEPDAAAAPWLGGLLSALNTLHGPTEKQMEEFNQKMDQFYNDHDEWLAEREIYKRMQAATVHIDLMITNEGTRPAKDIEVDLHFADDNSVMYGPDDATLRCEPTPPPVPTSGLILDDVKFRMPSFRGVTLPDLQLRNVSEPQIRKSNSYDVHFDVGSLKHEASESLGPLFLVFLNQTLAGSFGITFRVHAANMPKSSTGQLHVIREAD